MCCVADTIIVDENFEPVAIGSSYNQKKIGVVKGFNVYIHHCKEDKYFIQMPQKAFALKKIDMKKLKRASYWDDQRKEVIITAPCFTKTQIELLMF